KRFISGAVERGIPKGHADTIFELLAKFADYGFNKSHAAAYALVSYQTAWLKAHYPAEFMAAVLSSDMDNTDKVVGFLDEARTIGLNVLPPDVNASGYMFEAADPDHSNPGAPPKRVIRYGLGAVKGVGRGACEAIVAAREAGPFTDLLDFCKRVDAAGLNKRTLEALIQGGAMDALAKNRASLMLQLPEVVKATDQLARERDAGQVSLFGGGDAAPALEVLLTEVEEWPLAQKLTGERETLGHYLSGHPLDPYRDDLRALVGTDLGELDKLWSGAPQSEKKGWRPEVGVVVAGQVVALRRKGDSQVFVQLEDGRGRIECSVFAEAYTQMAPLLTRDRILVIQGGLREDEFSGGFSLRVRQCWDYAQLCASHAQRLSLRLDMRVPGLWDRIDALLARNRPGATPLRLDVLLNSGDRGVAGVLDLNGPKSVRVDTDLLDALRAHPGVRTVKVAISRPWAN
ncbi:MAG: OB-fold nucleic acid binding domain-containing protein, partial [Pseudoxanthomonas sp.]